MHRRARPVRRRKNTRGRDKDVISGHGRADMAPWRTPWKARSCPLWVKSRHWGTSEQCPLYPRKQTSVEPVGMSALCQKRTWATRYHLREPGRRSSKEQLARTTQDPRRRGSCYTIRVTDVRFGSKADIAECETNVRFTPRKRT
jgi:hypothetical protein